MKLLWFAAIASSIAGVLACRSEIADDSAPPPVQIPLPQYLIPPPRPQVVLTPAPTEAPAAKSESPPPPATQEPTDSTPPNSPPAAPPNSPTIPPQTNPVDDARLKDQVVYENDYLRLKERLFADAPGKWVAIVNGRMLPADARGRLAPTGSLGECLKAADEVDEKPPHRYVFRVGEEGDVVYGDTSKRPRNVAGSGLKALLGMAAFFDAGSGEIRWTRGDRVQRFKLDAELVTLPLTDVSGRQSMTLRVADSDGFTGFIALESDAAALLDCAKFEIPGRVLLRLGGEVAELRRARVRLRLEDLALDELVPVATWSR